MATRHGCARDSGPTSEHAAWNTLKQRCLNPRNPRYASYGGRGITVCDRWRDSFESFLADMGPRPSPAHSLDRIDNDGPYAPENCRWATRREQQRNRRANRLITIDGVTRSSVEWNEVMGFPHATVTKRLHAGWTEREAILTPHGRRRRIA